MKNSFKVLLLLFMLALPLAASAADKSPTGQAAQAEQPAPDVAKFDKQLAQMQETMHTMQEQMDKIQQTQNPQEGQKLLQDHWTTVQNAMQATRGRWGPRMMGCCKGNTWACSS